MNRIVVGLLIAIGSTKSAFGQFEILEYPPSKMAFDHYRKSEQEARNLLIQELNAAMNKAKAQKKFDEVKSIEALKARIVAGFAPVEKNAKLRETLDGSVWTFDGESLKLNFTKSEVIIGAKSFPYRPLGPLSIQYEETRLYFHSDFKRVFGLSNTFESRIGTRK